MKKELQKWLNGRRNFAIGVSLLSKYDPGNKFLTVFRKGKNDIREKNLFQEILSIYRGEGKAEVKPTAPVSGELLAVKKAPNPALYEQARQDANNLYKEVMNKRAVLFNLADVSPFENPNLPDKIRARAKLAIETVLGYDQVTAMYTRAEFVKERGYLPDIPETRSEFDNLPDHLVKAQLDNTRKALSKLKHKEPTADRVALKQKHETNIKKLSAKWDLIKP